LVQTTLEDYGARIDETQGYQPGPIITEPPDFYYSEVSRFYLGFAKEVDISENYSYA